MTLSGRSLCPPFAPGTCLHPASQASRWTVRSRYMQTSFSPETNVSLYQDVYISDTGCQMLYKVNLPDSSCVPFGWRGRYAGPGKFCFAFPTRDRVLVFTDHSAVGSPFSRMTHHAKAKHYPWWCHHWCWNLGRYSVRFDRQVCQRDGNRMKVYNFYVIIIFI